MKTGPTRETRSKVARALGLLREAMPAPGWGWEATCAIGRAIDAARQVEAWQVQYDRDARDLMERARRERAEARRARP